MDGQQVAWIVPATGLDVIVSKLRTEFDEVIAPVERDGAVRLDVITSADDLPLGVVADQEAGSYRIRRTSGSERFAHGLGPDSIKSVVLAARTPVWSAALVDGDVRVTLAPRVTVRRALLGVRPCDVAALARLDRTQLAGPHPDRAYGLARDGLFIVTVECTHPGATCFCSSVGTGPHAETGFDLALTEVPAGARGGTSVAYLVRAGSDAGRDFVDALDLPLATDAEISGARRLVDAAYHAAVRELSADAAAIVLAAPEHPEWEAVASRCLACGNCTAVCPTCFCTDLVDDIDVSGTASTRTRVWDTCFSLAYSQLAGAPHRTSTRSLYRQWLTHKLGTWHDHFGESGCVGCGRCITWCPAGIDLTAEVEALAEHPPAEVST